MEILFHALGYALLLSCLPDMGSRRAEQRFSFGLVRMAVFTPLLALEYLYFSFHMQPGLVAPLFFSETAFALTGLLLASSLQPIMDPAAERSAPYRIGPLLIILAGAAAGGFWAYSQPIFNILNNSLTFLHYSPVFLSSLFVLVAVLVMAWRLEAFGRALGRRARKPYKWLLIGLFLLIGSLAWSTSLRLTYLQLKNAHLLLLALLLLLAWVLIVYAVVGSRLLNRKIFISRKIIYSTVAPFIFAVYLIVVGFVSLLMKTFGWPMHFVLQWLLIVAGLLLAAGFAFSERLRSRVQYFISTHFYVNKYEYRDEWLAFSELLHHKLTETGVVDALRHILHDSLYTDTIKIWIGDKNAGFHLTTAGGGPQGEEHLLISADDPLVAYLRSVPCLDCLASAPNPEQQRILAEKKDFLETTGLVLLMPIAIGEHFLGIIGLGPEYTGGRYGKDDFDLLAALGSQAASVLLSVRMAEELAQAREQAAWHTLSAFVLHDIKNAATMLSLVKTNAPRHIHDPEFQADMLESVDDALSRMTKVQARLNSLKGEIEPVIQAVDACAWLQNCCRTIARKLAGMTIAPDCPRGFIMHTDPDFFAIIVENLLLNAMEAGSTRARVQLRPEGAGPGMGPDCPCRLECVDNGPGILPELLPERLFEPFITARPKGSGIGLWQVRRLVESLDGEITARNAEGGGAHFLITFAKARCAAIPEE